MRYQADQRLAVTVSETARKLEADDQEYCMEVTLGEDVRAQSFDTEERIAVRKNQKAPLTIQA